MLSEQVAVAQPIAYTLEAQEVYLADDYGVTIVGVFGSYVRGEQRHGSDVDILIELERPPRISLIGLVELEHYLSDLLGMSDRIIHGYDAVDLQIVWDVVKQDIPEIKPQIQQILADYSA